MCGISGIYRFAGEHDDVAVVERMNERLRRRGPDDGGSYQSGPVTLGNRRLAILDVSARGHQPMRSANGRFAITFNGEIYNHKDLARELGIEAELRSRSDTEVVLWAWERWGTGTLNRMVGQWAFAIYDNETRTLTLARDRFGEKPLYYHRDSNSFAFASSIAALLEAPWVPRQLDPDALNELLSIRYVVAPRTVLTDISKLPPGCLLKVGPAGISQHRWYTTGFRRDPRTPSRSTAALAEEFGELLAQGVRRCLVSDVPVALLLSDGIDSNSILHVLREQGHQNAAYTFSPIADGGEALLGGSLPSGAIEVPVPVSERIEQMVPAFSSLTEPVGDGAALATWLLIRGARENATVFLCGHGCDEVVGGYRLSYDRSRIAILNALSWAPSSWVENKVSKYLHGAEPFAERWRRLRHSPAARAPDAVRYLMHRPLPAQEVRDLADNHGDAYLATIDQLYGDSVSPGALDRMQEVLIHTFLSTNILSWADAVAMDASAELRMPFLDRDLVEFVFALPPHLRVGRLPGRTKTKVILRKWGQGRLDDAVLARGKHGFPFGNLAEMMATHGDTLRARVLDVAPLRAMMPGLEPWLRHPPAYFREPAESTLWAILALGIWCEHLQIEASAH